MMRSDQLRWHAERAEVVVSKVKASTRASAPTPSLRQSGCANSTASPGATSSVQRSPDRNESGPTDLHHGRAFGIKASELLLHVAALPVAQGGSPPAGAGAAAR